MRSKHPGFSGEYQTHNFLHSPGELAARPCQLSDVVDAHGRNFEIRIYDEGSIVVHYQDLNLSGELQLDTIQDNSLLWLNTLQLFVIDGCTLPDLGHSVQLVQCSVLPSTQPPKKI